MTTRDELADLIYRTLNPEIQQDAGWMPTVDGTGNVVSHIAADAILARWRLVPVDSAPYVEPDAIAIDCPACHRPAGQLCYEIADEGTPYATPFDLNPGQYHHARTNAANERAAAQHRAADELTRHDQAAGHYDGPRLPPFDPNNPAMISAVKAYFEHGFDNATIMAASFPGLTPEIIGALRTDQHGPHED